MAVKNQQTNDYNFGVVPTKPYDFLNKKQCVGNYIIQMLTRTSRMFKYEGLPNTIPQRDLELLLQTCGFVTVAKVNGNLYAFGYTNGCGIGGEYNPYIMPTQVIISNAYLKMTGERYTIDKDCVVIRSDSMYQGLSKINSRYATQLVENDITFKRLQENARTPFVLSVTTDNAYQSALNFLKTIAEGTSGVVMDNAMFEGLKTSPFDNKADIKQWIEAQQYIKASWLQELGLNANYNMKRESLSNSEIMMNEDMLTPLVNDMLACRQEDVEKVNKMFGTNISVELDSTWKENVDQRNLEIQNVSQEENTNANEEVKEDESKTD